jgi:two-component system chemotaxis sensor kinase CheA
MAIDMSQFLQTFFEESFEGLETMEAGLLNLDVGTADPEAINAIFRAAHSIKGGSGTFGLQAVAGFTHVMETLLDEMRDGRRGVSQELVDALLASVDCLRDMLAASRDGADVDAGRIAAQQTALERLLDTASAGAAQPVQSEQSTSGSWRIRFRPLPTLMRLGNDPLRLLRELRSLGDVATIVDVSDVPPLAELDPEICHMQWELAIAGDANREKIAEIFEWVEDECELAIEPLAPQAQAEPPAPSAEPERRKGGDRRSGERRTGADRRTQGASGEATSIRVGIDKIDALVNLVGELVITQSMLSQFGEECDLSRMDQLRDGLAQLERNTRELQEGVMRIRMLPISFAFQRYPRMVHDLAGKLGKKVSLKISGEQTELDKTVMEKIGDPLNHLVRNAIDHGLESPEIRRAGGKPETGEVHLNAYHQGGNIVIEISDDGAGINKERVLAKARERGLVGADAPATDEAIFDLLFEPGFSTADAVSDVSGRGVGMDVVRRNINALGGRIEVRSEEGRGATFAIRLPLTLAILDGQLVKVGGEIYVMPLVSIIESLQVNPQQVKGMVGQAELYRLRDEYIPILRLYRLFNLEPENTDLTKGLLVVVEGDGQRVGLFVDDLLGQQQVVIKSLETNFRRVDGVSGATILGDGTVALILDVAGLVHFAHRDSRRARARVAHGSEAA